MTGNISKDFSGSGLVGFKFGTLKGRSRLSFDKYPQTKTEHVSGSVTGHIPSSSKGKTVKKTAIEDVEDDIDELPDSDFSRATMRLFYEIDNEKAG